MSEMFPLGYANLANIRMMEELYTKWMEDPASVEESWQHFFEGMQLASNLSKALPARQESADLRIYYLIEAYRTYGHLWAYCDCTQDNRPPFPQELDLDQFGLSDGDLNKEFPTGGILPQENAPLKTIIEALQETYCRSVGVEYMGLGFAEMEKWIQNAVEPGFPDHLQNQDKIAILDQLNQAEGFETFLHTKYVGQKRFSLEGAESFIPLMHALLEYGAGLGIKHAVLGMAHRGRLNVLANIMGKSYEYIFEEFEDYLTPELSESSGDVKYHRGFIGEYVTKNGQPIEVHLSANPSHLESVNPVVEGVARAMQELNREEAKSVVPILIHGDAAVSGQGVVYETMTLGKLNGYQTLGTIHVVINNQIGFTTLPKDGRSTRYCTDIAKAFSAPVLHVNGEDPQMCVAAARLAIELRQTFGCDVFIDLMGYRKYGHNEGDEPTFTQPLSYQVIKQKQTIRKLYESKLVQDGVLSQEQAEQKERSFQEGLQKILASVKSQKPADVVVEGRKPGRHLEEIFTKTQTQVPLDRLRQTAEKLLTIPSHFQIHPKVNRLVDQRRQMMQEDPKNPSIDWGMAEMLSYATLVEEGIHIRLSGQDCRRGTFSHRHALYVDQVSADHYFPLSHVGENQAPCDVFNSPLSEFAVLGFEVGYSLTYPKSLVLWEAQYGDFANTAQVIIDQYLSSSEMKWGKTSNLTLLLPHGYEGSGPEHSSARIERYLQLCAEENMQVVNATMPAQMFHLLRRQGLRQLQKPLIIATPKAFLRSPMARSALEEFTSGTFEEILDDPSPPTNPKRILFCSGKIFFELIAQREKRSAEDVILRIEQLYPFHESRCRELLAKYPSAQTCLFVQEEHENMGPWRFLKPYLERALEGNKSLAYVGRKSAASPAAGSMALHKFEHEALLDQLYSKGT